MSRTHTPPSTRWKASPRGRFFIFSADLWQPNRVIDTIRQPCLVSGRADPLLGLAAEAVGPIRCGGADDNSAGIAELAVEAELVEARDSVRSVVSAAGLVFLVVTPGLALILEYHGLPINYLDREDESAEVIWIGVADKHRREQHRRGQSDGTEDERANVMSPGARSVVRHICPIGASSSAVSR